MQFPGNAQPLPGHRPRRETAVGEHGRDEEHGQDQASGVVGPCLASQCSVTMNSTAISPNATNAAMPSMSTGSR